MLKKDITFIDFEGNEVTETHYFNISKTEIVELELEFEEGLEAGLKALIAEKDNLEILRRFKKIIIGSYGRREGNSFLKDEEAGRLFAGSLAFDELMMSFFTDAENAAEFIRGILPRDLERKMTKDQPKEQLAPPAPPAPVVENEV